jgi:short subunit dehydrogenase-like uncharacterized protein
MRVFRLARQAEIVRQLAGVQAVLHCAGPFSATARPMFEACLAAGVHYLDITGEIDVIQWVHAQHERARAGNTVAIPAVGMDVVPSDCLAALLAEELPGAVQLELAFGGQATLSPGTLKTIWQNAARGGRIRRDGTITRVPTAWKVIDIPFARGPRPGMTIPWGDVATAYYTTGIPNIEVYVALPARRMEWARRYGRASWLLGLWPVQALGCWWIGRHVRGPSPAELERGRVEFWGRASDGQGRAAEATLETPNGYRLTVDTALAALQRVLSGQVPAGFHTPAAALGRDFICQLPGVRFQWRKRASPETATGDGSREARSP